jgi:hypothetical protein
MKSTRRSITVVAVNFAAGIFIFYVSGVCAQAQDEDFRLPGPIPAPIRFVPGEQKSRLDAEPDVKKRSKAFLELAEARLTQAEALTAQQDYTAAALELGNYQGLVHDSIVFLQAQPNNGKTRDMFKNLEITLRTHCPRLEGIRRSTPLAYGSDVKDVIRFTEDSRDVSLSCFFGDTVLRAPAPATAPAAKPSEQTPPKTP